MIKGIPPGAEVVYYATAYGQPGPVSGQRPRIGPTHPAPSFGEARRHLDWLDMYGVVQRWTRTKPEWVTVARRLDNGDWQQADPAGGWVSLRPGDVPGHPTDTTPEPAPAPAATPPDLAALVALRGHTVSPHPAPLPKGERWTCDVCEAVALRTPDGHLVGPALRDQCSARAVAQPPTAS